MEEKTKQINLCDWKKKPFCFCGFLPFLLLDLGLSSCSVFSVIMSSSSSPEEYVPPVVPNCISASYAQELKEEVRAMVQGDIKEFYPEVVVSYASGKRPGDADGTGPGFVQAFQFIQLLKQNGILCFSGLHVPAGGNWKTYFLRLNGEKANAKVFIALLDHAYFESIPRMMELHVAIEATSKVEIVLVRMEDDVKGEDGEVMKRMPPRTEHRWKGTMETEDDELARMEARNRVGRNAIPHPGTLLTAPKTFKEILFIVRKYCKFDAPTCHSIFEHGSSSNQVTKTAQETSKKLVT